MLRALLSGVTGLKSHQVRMDVIGNNIANVNTIGFKASRVTFREGFAEVLASATRSTSGSGSVNPQQVGSGVRVGSIDPRFTQGALEATGSALDLAIQGDGLFVVSNGERNFFSRAGNFQIDTAGRLVLGGTGFIMRGLNADQAGNLDTRISDIVLRLNDQAPPHVTTKMELTGNFDAEATVGATHDMAVTVYDVRGRAYDVTLRFTNVASGRWDWVPTSPDGTVTPATGGSVTFNADGTLNAFTYNGGATGLTMTAPDASTFNINVVSAGASGALTSYAGNSNAQIASQDGFTAGDLVSIRIESDGLIRGVYANGVTLTMGRIAMATFVNPEGLMRTGGNVFEESASSGPAVLGFSGTATTSTITSGALERSNVDISEEFTNMIVTQRGFQANARVITTADDMLNELINLRR